MVVAVLLAACGSDGETVDAPDIDESVSVRPVDEPEGDSLGLTTERILFGQSAALSGPAKELGRNMRMGILAAFDEVNAAGGVHGRVLELQSLDDAYEPEDAIVMT
ncbi:MAG: ABC transporter substrate-binding protein, partial [Chloroflexota bacterium]|nr:ABC transporter substrate-binding protein [Chloroflexota bacterium]